MTSSINGKYMARVGDMVVCTKCKGVFAIHSGSPDMTDGQGRSYARDMDMTDCGARLISSEARTIWSDKSLLSDPSVEAKIQASNTASEMAVSTTSGICLDCLRKAAQFGSAVVIRE